MRVTSLLALPFALLLFACDGDDVDTTAITVDQAAPLCEAACANLVACNSESTPERLAACKSGCLGEVAGHLRADAVEQLSDCLASATCTAEQGIDRDVCVAEIQPLQFHEDYEVACRSRLTTACEVLLDINVYCEVDVVADSESRIRFLPETTITRLTSCLAETACEATLACLDDILEAELIDD